MPEDLKPFTAAADLDQAALSRGTISGIAYSGGLMNVAAYSLPVAVDVAGIEVRRERLPLLANHQKGISDAVGYVEVVKEPGRVLVTGRISERTAAGKAILEAAADGIPFELSIGANVLEVERVRDGKPRTINGQAVQNKRGFMHARKSLLTEVSIVPIGADSKNALSITADGQGGPMPDITPTTTDADDQDTPKARRAVVEASGCKFEDLNLQFICGELDRSEWSEQAMKRLQAQADLQAHRDSRPTAPTGFVRDPGRGAADQDVLAAAILRPHHSETALEAMFGERVMEASARLNVQGIPAIAWKDPSRLPAQLQAASSTISLPTLLGDTLHRSAVLFYGESRRFWSDFSYRQPVSDFKNHNTVRPIFAGTAEEVGENGELKHTSLSEADVFTGKVATFGKIFGVGRQTMINDSVGAIAAQITRSLVDQIVRKQNDIAAEVWLAGIAANHWSAGNGNKQSGATTALSAEGLRAALQLMREQTDAEGKVVEVEPTFLMVGPSLEFTAKQLLNSSELSRFNATGDNAPNGNPHQGALRLIVEPRLENATYTGAVTGHWWIVGRQMTQPCIAYFLNGVERPTVERDDQDFHVLGEMWRCYMDSGFKLAETRASVYSVGA